MGKGPELSGRFGTNTLPTGRLALPTKSKVPGPGSYLGHKEFQLTNSFASQKSPKRVVAKPEPSLGPGHYEFKPVFGGGSIHTSVTKTMSVNAENHFS